jgi:ribulose-bisphosphate carboxylase small chain
MNEIRDYPSSLADPASRKFETFSYLPELNKEQIRQQVEYLVSQGWHPAIEHTEPENAGHSYWYMWKLPLFGETDIDRILAEAEACHKVNPSHHVRLVGYDTRAQCLGTALVIYRVPIEAVA